MTRLTKTFRNVGRHPTYSEDKEKQIAIAQGLDAMFHSIMDLVEDCIHQRLTQFGSVIINTKSE